MNTQHKDDKPTETTEHTLPPGASPTAGQTYKTPEPKRRADDTTGAQEPSAQPERAPQHQPGYEAKQKAEEAKAKPKDEHKDAANEHKPAPRSHAARAKQHVKRGNPALKPDFKPTKKRIRKHK
jgi:hypothetical protein